MDYTRLFGADFIRWQSDLRPLLRQVPWAKDLRLGDASGVGSKSNRITDATPSPTKFRAADKAVFPAQSADRTSLSTRSKMSDNSAALLDAWRHLFPAADKPLEQLEAWLVKTSATGNELYPMWCDH